MNIKNKNILNYLMFAINSLVFFLIVYCVVCFSQHNTIIIDDLYTVFIDKEVPLFRHLFLDVYHGRILGNLLTKFVGYIIPTSFGIHPVTWIQTGGAIIKGILTAIICFLLAKALFIYKKPNFLLPVVSFIFYIFYQANFANMYQNVLYSSFFGFTFPFIFYYLFWTLFVKYCENQELQTKSNLIKLIIYAFLLATSTETTSFTSIASLCIYLFINKFIIKNNKIAGAKYIFTSMFLGFVTYVTNPGFLACARGKGTFTGFKETFYNAFLMWREFWHGYKYTFQTDFLHYTIIIIALIILYSFYGETNKRKFFITTSVSLLLGAHLFFFSLLFAGHGTYQHIAYVIHFDLIMQIKMIFLYIIFYQIGMFRFNKKLFYSLAISPIILLYLFNFNTVNTHINKIINVGLMKYSEPYNFISKRAYKNRYLEERIIAYYAYINKFPSLPKLNSNIQSWGFKRYVQNLYNKNYSHTVTRKNVHLGNYSDIYNEYLNNGGPQIDKAEIMESDFNSLLDKNFVLTGKHSSN